MPSLLVREELFHLLRAMRSLAHTLFLSAQTCMHPESFINFNWKRSSAFGSPVLFIIAVQNIELILLNGVGELLHILEHVYHLLISLISSFILS